MPLLGVWDNFDDIDFSKLPDRFVLKANHGSGWNIIVKDKSKFDIKDAREKFKKWLNTNFAFQNGLELHYMNIQPKIIAEEYIEEAGYAFDYRFMCFGGKTEFIWFDTSAPPNRKRALYSTDWVRLEKMVGHYPPVEGEIAKPQFLEKMLQLAAILSQGFIHVRVDFYEIHGRIYFGEMTFTPASGTCVWNPPEQERFYGDLIQLPV